MSGEARKILMLLAVVVGVPLLLVGVFVHGIASVARPAPSPFTAPPPARRVVTAEEREQMRERVRLMRERREGKSG